MAKEKILEGPSGPPPPPEIDINSLGGSIQILAKEEVKLTPKQAEMFLHTLDEFQGERNMDAHWADHLAHEMQRDNFRWEHVLLATAQLGNRIFRINGQHTCWARLEFRDDPSYSKSVTLLRYKVGTEEDLRNLYSAFDQHGRRSRGHVIMAQLAGFGGWGAVSPRIIQRVAQGFPLFMWPDPNERRKYDARDHAYLLKTEFMDLGTRVGMFLSDPQKGGGVDSRHLHRAAVVAAMLGTFKRAPEAALEFWQAVADGVGIPAKTDPRNKLRTELLGCSVDSGAGSRTNKRRITAEEMLRMCIHAWNAWRKGETRQSLRVDMRSARPTIHR